MDALFFESPEHWRGWLERHHETEPEAVVGFWRVATGKQTMTWSQSVDEALCFGWIDSIAHRLDADRYTIRFTPRRPGSHWSRVNIGKVQALSKAGRMRPAGLSAFAKRDERRTAQAVYEREAEAELSPEEEATFRGNAPAWTWFHGQPPWYRRTALRWVIAAKLPATRARRLGRLIEDSGNGRPIPPLARNG